MNRRDFITKSIAVGLSGSVVSKALVANDTGKAVTLSAKNAKLIPPGTDPIPVAFLISSNVELMDCVGPYEVLSYVKPEGRAEADTWAFKLYTVSEEAQFEDGVGGIKISANYTFENAPQPKVIVVPAQKG